jgi:hypothetical protein
MNSAAIMVATFPVLLIVGALLAPLLARRERSRRDPHGPRFRDDYPGRSRISDPGAAIGANEGAADDPLAEGDQYFIDWAALQARFFD